MARLTALNLGGIAGKTKELFDIVKGKTGVASPNKQKKSKQ